MESYYQKEQRFRGRVRLSVKLINVDLWGASVTCWGQKTCPTKRPPLKQRKDMRHGLW